MAQWCSARIAIHEAFRVLPDTHVLRGVFRALGIVPAYPTFAQFCAEPVLYLRFSPVKKFAKLFYVGSTEKSTTAREHTRYRKYKQVLDEKLVSAELVLRYWAFGTGSRFPCQRALHPSSSQAASKLLFKPCSLL